LWFVLDPAQVELKKAQEFEGGGVNVRRKYGYGGGGSGL
jgi:hypothetical protein